MAMAVTMGALCQCQHGNAPCPLLTFNTKKSKGCSLPFATTSDFLIINMPTFGMCSSLLNPIVLASTLANFGVLTPQPCLPVVVKKWSPGSPTVQYEGKPALNSSSTVNCIFAGKIEIKSPGALTIMIP